MRCMMLTKERGTPMTPEQRERMNELCRQMQAEKDGAKLSALAEELNQLLVLNEQQSKLKITQPTTTKSNP